MIAHGSTMDFLGTVQHHGSEGRMAPAACSWPCLALFTSVFSSCCFSASLLHLVFSSTSLVLEICWCPLAYFRFPYLFCFRRACLLLLLPFFFCLLASLWLLEFVLIMSCPWLIVISSLTCSPLPWRGQRITIYSTVMTFHCMCA